MSICFKSDFLEMLQKGFPGKCMFMFWALEVRFGGQNTMLIISEQNIGCMFENVFLFMICRYKFFDILKGSYKHYHNELYSTI